MRDEAHGYAAQGCTAPVADLYVGGKSFDTAKEGLAMVAAMKQKPALLQSRIRSAPVLASMWAIKLAACCCTRRYSVVCVGRWRS